VDDAALVEWFARLVQAHEDQSAAIHDAYQQLENAGLTNRVVVHRYLCRKGGCKLATVVRIGGRVLARTRDYKYGPGMNLERSVPAARERNTLDGDRHWPGHTFDVTDLARWGDSAGMDMNCRHGMRTVLAVDVLATVGDTRPGHPGAPSRI
jgi:hypothetical protein